MGHEEERFQFGIRPDPLVKKPISVDLCELERLINPWKGPLEVVVKGLKLLPSLVLSDGRHVVVRLGLDLRRAAAL